MMTTRVIEKMNNRWWDELSNRESCENDHTKFDGLQITDIGGIFIFLLLGIVVACLMLTFEYYWYKSNRLRILANNKRFCVQGSETFTAHNVSPCDDTSGTQSHASYAHWHQLISAMRRKSQNRISLESTKSISLSKSNLKQNQESSVIQQ